MQPAGRITPERTPLGVSRILSFGHQVGQVCPRTAVGVPSRSLERAEAIGYREIRNVLIDASAGEHHAVRLHADGILGGVGSCRCPLRP